MMMDMPPFDPGVEIVAATHGMSKGLGQTDGPQLVMTGRVKSGDFGIFARIKNVDSGGAYGEANAGLTWQPKLGGLDLELGVIGKTMVQPPLNADRHAIEFDAGIGRKFGSVTPKLKLTYSPDDLGSTGQSFFYRAEVAWKVADKWRLSGQVGRRDRDGGPDYWMGDIGISYHLASHILADVRFHTTDKGDYGDAYKRRIVGSIRASF